MEKSLSEKLNYYDISPEVYERTAVFPGDTPFSRKVLLDFKKGDHLLLSAIQTTVHVGAHVDAPNHYDPKGAGISERPLDYYYGPCQVISVQIPRNTPIKPSDIRNVKIEAPRVLFKTGSFPDPNHWNDDFNWLSRDLVNDLADRGVILIGIDTPSIDSAESETLDAHKAIFQRNLANMEGIILEEVPDGVYTLVALPLRIKGADASMVRAILIKR